MIYNIILWKYNSLGHNYLLTVSLTSTIIYGQTYRRSYKYQQDSGANRTLNLRTTCRSWIYVVRNYGLRAGQIKYFNGLFPFKISDVSMYVDVKHKPTELELFYACYIFTYYGY